MRLFYLLLLLIVYSCMTFGYAAQPIDLSHYAVSDLPALIADTPLSSLRKRRLIEEDAHTTQMKAVRRLTDFKQTVHIRMIETYLGYPVWGSEAVMHLPQDNPPSSGGQKGMRPSMNGWFYQAVQADLAHTPAGVFRSMQAQKALQKAIDQYRHGERENITHAHSRLIVFMTDSAKAHWAFHVSFYVPPSRQGERPDEPHYILDALSFAVYKSWNGIKTVHRMMTVYGGGWGGNQKVGLLVYDGLSQHLPKLLMQRDVLKKICYLQNAEVRVLDHRTNKPIYFRCDMLNTTHNNVYWDGEKDAVNGGYSPSNDALFLGSIVKNMYQEWYAVPVLMAHGRPAVLEMVVHMMLDRRHGITNKDNAYWDPSKNQIVFGDGGDLFYPLTSLDVAAHEISHGFTEQHAGLIYSGQSGAINEAFSDMAAEAAAFYVHHQNHWMVGVDVLKQSGAALRYMDRPSKDCQVHDTRYDCSIDSANQYDARLDVHFGSGVYNRAFYLMATAPGWNTKKAFDVMVQANRYYWTPNSTFLSAACGVLQAAKDYGYDLYTIKRAFAEVGIQTHSCA
jgi:pseudolysin